MGVEKWHVELCLLPSRHGLGTRVVRVLLLLVHSFFFRVWRT